MGKRRKKAVYVQYDYEAAYQQEVEKAEEQQLLDMLKEGKRQVYATKEVRAGEQLEVEIYPEFAKKERDKIPNEAQRKKQRQAQRNLNEKNSRKQCERVINENFTDRDIWATFTCDEDHVPKSMEEAKAIMQRYIKRLNYHRKKAGLPNARYVYVTECSKAGRWHYHIVLDGDMSMDDVEKLWTSGKRNQVRRLQKDENGLCGMAKYITKSPEEKGRKGDARKGMKSWTPSKNLRKPKEKVTHYKFKQKDVEKVVKDADALPELLAKWFAKEGYTYTSGEIRYNDFNGRFYIYARMRKPPEPEGGKDAKREEPKKGSKGSRRCAADASGGAGGDAGSV